MTGAWNTKSCRVHQARGNESVEKHVRRASAEPRRVHPNQGVHDDGQIGDTEANEEPVHDADLHRQTVGTRTPGAAIIGFRMMESSAAPPRETGCGNAGAPPARGAENGLVQLMATKRDGRTRAATGARNPKQTSSSAVSTGPTNVNLRMIAHHGQGRSASRAQQEVVPLPSRSRSSSHGPVPIGSPRDGADRDHADDARARFTASGSASTTPRWRQRSCEDETPRPARDVQGSPPWHRRPPRSETR